MTDPQGVQRIADALNAAHNAGITFSIGPNPHIRWDDPRAQWITAIEADNDDQDPDATWDGGHALVVEYGDCELIGHCQCGEPLATVTPDKPLDDLGRPWEKHVMGLYR
ncbi:hypothetical protein [Embleya sp. NPDC005971]|uniref:hypothetical protein n=1 Tax=Embleya sp. NPDC005971 TaxID=3156724 RepID=UPI0034074CB9